MSAKYEPAPEVEKIAGYLIPQHHQHLIDLKVRLRYVFVDKAPKSKGKEVWGTCRKVTGLTAHLEGGSPDDEPFFVISISKDVWDVLPPPKREALVDHELCHAWATIQQSEDDDGDQQEVTKLSVKPHDLEEFACIVRRHGLWRDAVRGFVEAALKSSKHPEDGSVENADKEEMEDD